VHLGHHRRCSTLPKLARQEIAVAGSAVCFWTQIPNLHCQSLRCPELTAAVQAPLQLQLNCCHTGSSTDAACCHMGCLQRLRYTKWAGGSRSQTHRRAAMCGFTQDDGYVRIVAADAQRFTRSLLDLLLDVRATFFKNTVLLINPWYRYRYRCLEQVPIAGAYSQEHCPRVYAICRSELG